MSYLFVVGAPGSKWSGAARSIYYSPSINRSDFREEDVYSHGGTGVTHLGAYFDPGMEYGNFFNEIEGWDKAHCEAEFDLPFQDPTGIKIIKSHVLSEKIPFLRQNWPRSPIVTVLREDDACLEWWLQAGGFDIQYPSYQWYENEEVMLRRIQDQNAGIRLWLSQWQSIPCRTNDELASVLELEQPPAEYAKNFEAEDTRVFVTLPW